MDGVYRRVCRCGLSGAAQGARHAARGMCKGWASWAGRVGRAHTHTAIHARRVFCEYGRGCGMEKGAATHTHVKEFKCCLCGKMANGHGNNAQPLREGKACDACNVSIVIPHRIALFRRA